ncbi:hypothetical protein ACJMK2_038450 [Sinanodonta woodiana]|uniref:SGNH hydrolase-type esterase domain-containing protein n=1 Tax=Sinanodonta woodiana TaxID=1069815 RepID=A0ABD3WCD5_SINWO
MRLLLVGHSIVARLASNNYLLQVCRVPPGLILQYRLQVPLTYIIFMQIGENEVGREDPSQIMSHIINLCRMYSGMGIEYILVGAFWPRSAPRGISVGQYNRIINSELSRIDEVVPGVHFVHAIGFHRRYLHVDGVHSSVQGRRWFFTECVNIHL